MIENTCAVLQILSGTISVLQSGWIKSYLLL